MFVLFAMLADPNPAGIEGLWRNPSGSVVMSIKQCHQTLCGQVETASEKARADARRGGTDSLVGATLLSELVPSGTSRWKARLFIPDANKSSRVEIRLIDAGRLKVSGCAVGRLLCKSQVWTRVE